MFNSKEHNIIIIQSKTRHFEETSNGGKYNSTILTPSKKDFLTLSFRIDSVGRLRTKLYDKGDDFNFPIVELSIYM